VHHGTFEAWFFKGGEAYVQERVEAARKELERAKARSKKAGKKFDDGGNASKVSEPSFVSGQLDYYRESSAAAFEKALEEKANGRNQNQNQNQNRGSERSGKTGRRINAPTVPVKIFDTTKPCRDQRAVGLSRGDSPGRTVGGG